MAGLSSCWLAAYSFFLRTDKRRGLWPSVRVRFQNGRLMHVRGRGVTGAGEREAHKHRQMHHDICVIMVMEGERGEGDGDGGGREMERERGHVESHRLANPTLVD